MLFHLRSQREPAPERAILALSLSMLLGLASCGGGGGGGIEPGASGPPRDVAGTWSVRVDINEASELLTDMIGEVITGNLYITQDDGSIEVADGSGLVAFGTVDGNMVKFSHVFSQQGLRIVQTYDLVVSTDGQQMPGTFFVEVDASSEGSGWARGVVSASLSHPTARGDGDGFLAVNTHPEVTSLVFLRLERSGCGQPALLGTLRPGEAMKVTPPQVPCTVFLVEAGRVKGDDPFDEAREGTTILYRTPEQDSGEAGAGTLTEIVRSVLTR